MHEKIGKNVIITGSAGVGLLFSLLSWVGFESSALYAEESKNPKKIIPIAITTSVLGVGIFYIIISWLAMVGTGPHHSIILAQNDTTAGDIIFLPAREYLGSWVMPIFKFLMITSTFACSLAFHNCASRYFYSLSREKVIPGISILGKTHSRYQFPHTASALQTMIGIMIVLGFAYCHKNPYTALDAIMAMFGTATILLVQTLVAVSIISYFHIQHKEQESAHWFRTAVAPFIGGIGMLAYLFTIY